MTNVIYHKADYDGIFCREIAKKFLPEANLIGWDYGDPVPTPDVVSSEDILYMLDISVEGLMDHPKLIWIDHHKSAIEIFKGSTPGYRIDGVAACRLAWQWFSSLTDEELKTIPTYTPAALREDFFERRVIEPTAVRFAGEYDVWDKRDSRAEIFQCGLRSRALTNFDWTQLLSYNKKMSIEEIESLASVGHQNLLEPDGTNMPAVIHGLLESGKIIQRYQQQSDSSLVHRSFMCELDGLKFLTLNTARCNSLTFAAKDVPETGHDALMGFYWNGSIFKVSLYHARHRTDIDLSQIAVKRGGGGHRGACGFETEGIPHKI